MIPIKYAKWDYYILEHILSWRFFDHLLICRNYSVPGHRYLAGVPE